MSLTLSRVAQLSSCQQASLFVAESLALETSAYQDDYLAERYRYAALVAQTAPECEHPLALYRLFSESVRPSYRRAPRPVSKRDVVQDEAIPCEMVPQFMKQFELHRLRLLREHNKLTASHVRCALEALHFDLTCIRPFDEYNGLLARLFLFHTAERCGAQWWQCTPFAERTMSRADYERAISRYYARNFWIRYDN